MISKNIKLRLYTSSILLSLVLLSIKFSFLIVYILIIFGVLSILEFLAIIEKLFKKRFYKLLLSAILILYISVFCYFFFIFSNFLRDQR